MRNWELLLAFNQNEAIRPYLAEYPFPAHRLKIVIDFVDSQYAHYYNGTLYNVILENGQLEYHQKIPEKESILELKDNQFIYILSNNFVLRSGEQAKKFPELTRAKIRVNT